MTWPGTPKSQQVPTINPPSMRFSSPLSEHSSMKDVAEAVRTAFNGLTVHEQAFANLPNQIATQAAAAATAAVENIVNETVTGVTSFNTQTGGVIFFPSLGTVNDQLGVTAYTTQNSDSGAKIIVGDSSAVTVNLNAGVMAPWFTIIDNDSSAPVTISVDSGVGFYGLKSLYAGGFAIVYYDGGTFYSSGYPGGLSATIITAKLTTLGTEGSMQFLDGALISQVAAT